MHGKRLSRIISAAKRRQGVVLGDAFEENDEVKKSSRASNYAADAGVQPKEMPRTGEASYLLSALWRATKEWV